MISVARFCGEEIEPYINEFARLRISVFKEFPYLYEGDIHYEKEYLKIYLQSKRSCLVVAKDQDKVIGVSSCIPLADESDEFKKPFLTNAYNENKYFYFGESVLEQNYRGQGLGVAFFNEREAHAKSFHEYDYCCFAAVDRTEDHPKRPEGYQNLHGFWRNRGFEMSPNLKMNLSWKEIGQERETNNTLTFWLKKI